MRLSRFERKGFENDWTWLAEWFGGPEALDGLDGLEPDAFYESTGFDGTAETVQAVFDAIATRMGIEPDKVALLFYDLPEEDQATEEGEEENDDAAAEDDDERNSGDYLGQNGDGKHVVGLKHDLLDDFESLVAALAHGLAHALLIGGGFLEENDEVLTDQVPIWFGFGVFGGNALLRFHLDLDGWHWSGGGSLTVEEYAYAMALREFLRGEDSPEWVTCLVPDLRSRFGEAATFLLENEDDIFENLEILEEEDGDSESGSSNATPATAGKPDMDEARRRRYGDDFDGPIFIDPEPRE